MPFDEAILRLQLSEKYPFRLSVAAEKTLAAPGVKQRPGRLQLRGFARGTALAILLSQSGLGFRPNRTPSGKMELLGVRTEDGQQIWSIGWDVPEGAIPRRSLRDYFSRPRWN